MDILGIAIPLLLALAIGGALLQTILAALGRTLATLGARLGVPSRFVEDFKFYGALAAIFVAGLHFL